VTLPSGFQESIVFSGLTQPAAVRFASDGRVFVAEKQGVIKVFDNLSDPTPTVFADLNANVYNFWDRGLLGFALDPNFPTNPYVYVLYAYDHALPSSGQYPGPPPKPPWGTAGVYSDPCPTPPGPTGDGCIISGRLSRLEAAGNQMTGPEQVLIEDWCQQYPSHSIGALAFGADGALYVSGGDGASFNFADYGQDGNPLNPCGDPPGGVGAALSPPTAEGGALRSQDLRTPPPPPPPPPPLPDPLRLSSSSTRTPSADLEGAALASGAQVCVYLSDSPAKTGPVDFYLDGAFVHQEGIAPWDYFGGTVSTCNLGTFANGTHTIRATWTGGEDSSTFTAGAPPPPAADPVSLDGAILRVDPATGAALPDNPLALNPDPNARRIIAYGLRNPFRITVRPGTNDVWFGDVGWNTWEEINRIPNPTDATVENFGWPCYEGAGRQGGYDSANLNICETLYGEAGAVTGPVYTYNHSAQVVPGETCPTGSSSTAGVAFYNGGNYPTQYNGALFFADYSRDCIWVMFAGADGLPDPANRATFVAPAANPVDLQIGPGGDLFYADFDGGTIRRIRFLGANNPPNAVATANPTQGPAPLTVNFDGTGSSDPDPGDTITYAWDLNGDGQYDDSTSATPTYTYAAGSYTVRLRVTDNHGASSVSSPITISASNTPPTATIVAPSATTTWRVGDVINFSGSATDAQDGQMPASALSWSLILHHCPSNCHTHPLQTFPGVASGSFTAPDHEYPSHLELTLTATDSGGLTDTKNVLLYPQTVDLTFQSSPTGLQLTLNGTSATAPYTRTVITGSNNSISAPTPQTLAGSTYEFSSWSDGGAQTHNITATATATYTATYVTAAPTNTVPPSITGPAQQGKTMTARDGTWTGGTPMTFAYQWRRCNTAGAACVDLAGATANTYSPVAGDVGSTLRVVVTATNTAGSTSATSAPTAVVRARR
jgi:glucose/arabinose dehydrogenase